MYGERVTDRCEGDGNDVVGMSAGHECVCVLHVVQVLCLAQLMSVGCVLDLGRCRRWGGWIRGLGLGSNNHVGTRGVLGRGLGPWSGRVRWCYVCVSCVSE